MSLDADQIVDRRRMRRKLTFWRVIATLVVIAGIVGGAVAMRRGGPTLHGPGGSIARITIQGLIRSDQQRVEALEQLGKEVGCSAFYLSRTFSQETGSTIPQYLQRLRMDRAAELLRSGEYNVTEAALEVGYSSFSHFSLAFRQTHGCCPGLFPVAKK